MTGYENLNINFYEYLSSNIAAGQKGERMMKRNIFIIIVFILFAAPAFSGHRNFYIQGDYRKSIVVDNRERTYFLHLPNAFNSRMTYPLLLGLHGGGGSGEKFSKQTNFNIYADKEGFIAVYPDGIEHGWSDGRGTTDAEKSGVDDVKFIRALIGHLKDEFRIDTKRIYATGVSNGGIFSHRLACEMSDVFAAIGSDVGPIATNMASKCNPLRTISVVAIQGTADPVIPINGGAVRSESGGLVESAENTVKLWASKNGCSNTSKARLPVLVHDGTAVSLITCSDCRDNTEVVYYIVDGMGHTWPSWSSAMKRGRSIQGPGSYNIDATDVFWKFFKEQRKVNNGHSGRGR